MSCVEEQSTRRRAVFVVGSARSGTSTMAGALRALGMHVPGPEVVADEGNPKGFGESQWVVDLHEELLHRSNVQMFDSRPSAWFDAGKLAHLEPLRGRLHHWLESQFVGEADPETGEVVAHPELVVKDPRLAWFIGLWRSASLRCGVAPAYVTMLRPVTEVVGSKQRYQAETSGDVQRTAAWVNTMLHTERATRGSSRAFVRYGDLLQDWTVPVFGLGRQFGLLAVEDAQANDVRAVQAFIDPRLRRARLTWDDLDVPPRLREIAEECSQHLDLLADPDGDRPAVHDTLDELRSAYAALYSEAEAISRSTAVAARREGPPRLAVASDRSPGAARLPHRVRALVPAGLRRWLRKAVGTSRG